MEAKVKIILNTAKSKSEVQKMLKKEKFRDDDISMIIQKYYKWVLIFNVISRRCQ